MAGTVQPVKLGDSHDGFALATVGSKIVVSYANKDDPKKISFRVVEAFKAGLPVVVELPRSEQYSLRCEDLVLGVSGEKVWFANRLDFTRVYELKISTNP